MDGKQKGFTLIEILVVVTIIGVLAGLVVVLIPKGQFEAQKTDCLNNCKNLAGMLEAAAAGKQYPRYSGPNLLLYFVVRGEMEGEDNLGLLFCPGDANESLEQAGGVEAYADIDLKKRGEYDALTSYAGRDQQNAACAAKTGSSKTMVLLCDDSEDHHGDKGFCVGLTGGAARWRHKFDNWELDVKTSVKVGEDSAVPELQCLRVD